MSESELYEIARQRIDRRNRRWFVWSIDLAILISLLGVMALTSETVYTNQAAAAFFVWAGVFTTHTIWIALAGSRERHIEAEVAKLREVAYEKPKRLELTDDGEFLESTEDSEEARSVG